MSSQLPSLLPHGSQEDFARFQMCAPGEFWRQVTGILNEVNASGCLLVVDEEVARLHPKKLPLDVPKLLVPGGERAKTFQGLQVILEGFLASGLDRKGCVVALGGGVVCDMTAFAASMWLRGIGCILCPTTLLCQVDAGLGGKSAINFHGGKNLLGSIRPALQCICDVAFLQTLSTRELSNGLSEAVKMAVLYDKDLFQYMEDNASRLVNGEIHALKHIVLQCLALKAHIVRADPLEQGLRKQLNFGHTLGHPLEAVSDLRHGEAIALGMEMILGFGVEQFDFPKDQYLRICRLLNELGLPSLSVLNELPLDRAAELIRLDKKRRDQCISVVMPTSIGARDNIELVKMEVGRVENLLRPSV